MWVKAHGLGPRAARQHRKRLMCLWHISLGTLHALAIWRWRTTGASCQWLPISSVEYSRISPFRVAVTPVPTHPTAMMTHEAHDGCRRSACALCWPLRKCTGARARPSPSRVVLGAVQKVVWPRTGDDAAGSVEASAIPGPRWSPGHMSRDDVDASHAPGGSQRACRPSSRPDAQAWVHSARVHRSPIPSCPNRLGPCAAPHAPWLVVPPRLRLRLVCSLAVWSGLVFLAWPAVPPPSASPLSRTRHASVNFIVIARVVPVLPLPASPA